MKKILNFGKKTTSIILTLTVLLVGLVGCGSSSNGKTESATKEIRFGVSPGPYGDLVKLAIQPELEKKGYKVTIKEFSDYIQPNLALSNNEIDVNVFQHEVYLKNFCKQNNLDLVSIKNIPTAGMGLFSNKYKSINELKDGGTVSIPNDVANLARALRFLDSLGIIKLKNDVDLTTVSEKDIVNNPKNLKFAPVEAAQIPRTLDSTDLAVITGNYAIASGLSLSDALEKEKLSEEYKNVVAVRTSDKDSQFAKDIEDILNSEEFKKVILSNDNIFKDFDFPEWFNAK